MGAAVITIKTMVDILRWGYNLPGAASVTILIVDSSGESVQYEVTISGTESECLIQHYTDGIQIESQNQTSNSETGTTLQLQCQVRSASQIQRLRLQAGQASLRVLLPRPDVLTAASDAIDGEEDAIHELLDTFGSPTAILFLCYMFLSVDELVTLIGELTTIDRYASSRLHATRYAIVRGLLLSETGTTIQSADDFEILIEGLNRLDNIGDVEPIPALGDVLAATPFSPTDVDERLAELGFDRKDLEQRRDGLFLLAELGYRALRSEISDAEALAQNRDWHLDQDYEQAKQVAETAEYGERGVSWRRVLCSAARHSREEFQHALVNALYWTASELRTDSQLTQLLYEAADALVGDAGIEYIEDRAKLHRRLAEGHRLRSHNQYALAERQFERAVQLARGHDYLEAEARQARAITTANRHLRTNDYELAVSVLDTAVNDIITLDPPDEQATHLTRVLLAKKEEIDGLLAQSRGKYREAVEHLTDAIGLFETLGFDRSRERVANRRDRLRAKLPSEEKAPDTGHPKADQQQEQAAEKPSGEQVSEPTATSDHQPAHEDHVSRANTTGQSQPETDTDRPVDPIDPDLYEPLEDSPAGLHRHGESRRLDDPDREPDGW